MSDLETMADEDIEGQPDLPVLIDRAMIRASERIRASAPGIVRAATAASGTVAAQQAITTARDGTPEPTVPDVPALQLRSGDAFVYVPPAVGEPNLLLYADRSLDEWAATDGTQAITPADPRAHDPTDCVALPFAPGAAPTGRETDLALGCADGEITITDEGLVELASCEYSVVRGRTRVRITGDGDVTFTPSAAEPPARAGEIHLAGETEAAVLGTSFFAALSTFLTACSGVPAIATAASTLSGALAGCLSSKVKLG